MKIKLFITGVISYVAMLFSFFYYSMAQSAHTTPEYNVYRDAAMRHVDLLYNTNLHVDPAQINTYLGFFIISSVVLFVTCIMFYKRIGKGILDIVIMSLIYFSLNYSIIICSFVYSLIVIPYYSAFHSTLYYSNLIIGTFLYVILCIVIKRSKERMKLYRL